MTEGIENEGNSDYKEERNCRREQRTEMARLVGSWYLALSNVWK